MKKAVEEFKVDDVVRFKINPKFVLHIVEVTKQVCYADCKQIWYTGRVHFAVDKFGQGSVGAELKRFSAIEVEAIPAKTKEKVELEKKIENVKKEKEDLIKAQDFEKAASKREDERKLKMDLELLD
jgi:protein-arginine kinase activator protein McsA